MISSLPLTIITVNFNTSEFVELMIYALKKLTYHPYRLIIADNGSNATQRNLLKKITQRQVNITTKFLSPQTQGSASHAIALNQLVKFIHTPYFSILDSDAVWLKKNWDKILISDLSAVIKVIGTQPAPTKPQDFPLMYAILFETAAFKTLNIDFSPHNIQQYQDTGYQLREKYLPAGYSAKVLEARYTRKYKQGPFKDLICAEYYHPKHQDIFASHFSRGATLGENKYKRSHLRYLYQLPLIGGRLLSRKGINERNQWIRICREIIDIQ